MLAIGWCLHQPEYMCAIMHRQERRFFPADANHQADTHLESGTQHQEHSLPDANMTHYLSREPQWSLHRTTKTRVTPLLQDACAVCFC